VVADLQNVNGEINFAAFSRPRARRAIAGAGRSWRVNPPSPFLIRFLSSIPLLCQLSGELAKAMMAALLELAQGHRLLFRLAI
jgi:hypothetical protein